MSPTWQWHVFWIGSESLQDLYLELSQHAQVAVVLLALLVLHPRDHLYYDTATVSRWHRVWHFFSCNSFQPIPGSLRYDSPLQDYQPR